MELSPRGTAGASQEGWVIKQSRTLKRWRKRWMVLSTLHASTYKKERVCTNPTERIPVAEFRAITSVDDDPARPFLFRLDTSRRSYLLDVENKEERNAWIGAIGRVMARPHALKGQMEGDIPMISSGDEDA